MNNAEEALRFQARTTDQSAVNVRLAHQVAYVLTLDAPAVQDSNRLRRLVPKLLSKPIADGGVRFLRSFRRCSTSGTDRPDRFVGENDTQKVGGCQAVETARKLLIDYLLEVSRFPLCKCFADAQNRLQGRFDNGAHSPIDGLFGLAKILPSLRVSYNHHPAAGVFEHGNADLPCESPLGFPVHVLRRKD